MRDGSGGGCLRRGRGDGVAEGFELADQVADLALLIDVGVVPAGAEVVEAGGAVGEQVEDDDQDGAGDRGEGFALAAAPGDPPVAFAEEGIGAGGGCGDLAEHPVQVRVALPALPVVVFLPDWRVCGLRLAQETSRPEVPKTVMSRPISAMMAWAAMIPQPVISSRRATAGRMTASGRCRPAGR